MEESRLCEFLLILPLPNSIREQVLVFKEEFRLMYGPYNSRHAEPYIRGCDFLLFEHRTYDTLIIFKKRLKSLPTFTLNINGFDSYSTTKSIFLRVDECAEYRNLLTEVDLTRQMLRLKKNYFQNREIRIPVASNLAPHVFYEARDVFAKRKCETGFQVSHIDILKYDFITRKYQLFGQIPFGSC